MALDTENRKGALVVSTLPAAVDSNKRAVRNIPKMSQALKLAMDRTLVDPHERLSTFARTMHFALTVREGFSAAGGGSVDQTYGGWHASTYEVKVAKVGPLIVTSPASGDSVSAGVATFRFELLGYGANADAVSAAVKAATFRVDISTDAGATWTKMTTTSGGRLTSGGHGTINAVVPQSAAGQSAVFRVVSGKDATFSDDDFDECAFWAPTPTFTVGIAAALPTIASSTPAHEATDVSSATTLMVVKYSAAVQLPADRTGLTIKGASVCGQGQAVPATATLVTETVIKINGGTFGSLAQSTCYQVTIPDGYVKDAFGRSVGAATLSFSTQDGPPPLLPTLAVSSKAPASVTPDPGQGTMDTWGAGYASSTKIDPTSADTSKLVLTFSRVVTPIETASSNITIEEMDWYDTSSYYEICSMPITDAQVSVSLTTVTITPYSECRLFRTGQFRLFFPAGLIEDDVGNAYGGFAANDYYFFNTIADTTPPSIAKTVPTNDATTVTEGQPFIIKWSPSEFVFENGGVITFEGYWQGSLIETLTIFTNDTSQVATLHPPPNTGSGLWTWRSLRRSPRRPRQRPPRRPPRCPP